MRNDSIETLLLRHYGSTADAPVDLEQRLHAMVSSEAADMRSQQQAISKWNQRLISRRKVLRLMTFTSAGAGVLALGVTTISSTFTGREKNKPAYS